MQHISHSTFTPNTYRYYECSSGRPLKKNIIVVFLFGSTDLTSSSTSVSILSTPHSNAQLGLSDLDRTVQNFFDRGFAQSTLTSYQSGKGHYLAFCSQFQLQPLPLQEVTLCRFVAYLTNLSLGYQTVRCYLSALRHFQICAGFPDPSLSLLPRLNYMLKGVHRAHCHPCRPPRLPITPDLLCRIYHTWSRMDIDYDRSMLWAAFCLGFFGFL